MVSDSNKFSKELVEELCKKWREGPRLDYKSQILKLRDEKEQFSFIKDVIAFANTARRIGKPCWIVFGFDEKKGNYIDVSSQYPANEPDWAHDPNIPLATKQTDLVENVILQKCGNWIDQRVDMKYFYGYICEDEKKLVSYLEIRPSMTNEPFKLRKNYIPKKGTAYHIGDVFIRWGSSSVVLNSSEIGYLCSCSQALYLDKFNWTSLIDFYLKRNSKYFEKINDFPPLIKVGGNNIFDVFENFLKSDYSLMEIIGKAGLGKTTLLLGLTHYLAKKLSIESIDKPYFGYSEKQIENETTVNSYISALEVVPQNFVPIYFSMREHFSNETAFKETLMKNILGIVKYNNEDENIGLESVFNIPGSKWVLFLDGIDEIINREKFGPILNSWIKRLGRNVKVVIASRPDYIDKIDNYYVVELCPLTEELSKNYILQSIKNREIENRKKKEISKRIESILNQNDILKMLNNFRAIEGFLQWVDDTYIPDKPSLDLDEVTITSPTQVEPNTGNENIPQIDPENLDLINVDITSASKFISDFELEEPLQNENEFVEVEDACPAIKAVVDYMNQEEMKRNRKWGEKQDLVEEAEIGIEKISWYEDWEKHEFNYQEYIKRKIIKKHSIQWNIDVGWLERIPNNIYWCRYYTPLIHLFFAANYAFQWFRENYDALKKEITKRDIKKTSTTKVIELINQLRRYNGLEEFSFTNQEE